MRRKLSITKIGLIVSSVLLLSVTCITVYAQQQPAVTQSTGVSLGVIIATIGVSVGALIASIGGLLSVARSLQTFADHCANDQIHATVRDLDTLYPRRTECLLRHQRHDRGDDGEPRTE
jgi:hypothetical protein